MWLSLLTPHHTSLPWWLWTITLNLFRPELQPPSHPEMLFCFWKTPLVSLANALVSDNGPQFISVEFKEFLNQRGIVHCQTSVYNSKANGCVERVNRNISKLLEVQCHLHNFKTLQEVMNDYFISYNNTQHDTNGKKSNFVPSAV
jgi:transposase InsO family protein